MEKLGTDNMTNKQFNQFLESVKILAEKSESKQEFLDTLARIQKIGEIHSQK